jgi:hypothetical protein
MSLAEIAERHSGFSSFHPVLSEPDENPFLNGQLTLSVPKGYRKLLVCRHFSTNHNIPFLVYPADSVCSVRDGFSIWS